MNCNAGRYFGETLERCTFEHGHGGVCSWHAMGMTDGHLSAEIRRRGFDDRPALAMELTDEQLRAECIRRFPHGFGQVHETTIGENEKLRRLAGEALASLAGAGISTPVEGYVRAPHCLSDNIDRLARERDAWRREAEGYRNAAIGADQSNVEAIRERDEWKRRADVAEAKAAEAGLAAKRDLDQLVELLNTQRRPWSFFEFPRHESGPGIAAKPVTSRDGEDWPDPLDLLADDAA